MLTIQLTPQLHNTVYKLKKLDVRETATLHLQVSGISTQESVAVNGMLNRTLKSEGAVPYGNWV